jgi:hypothetical protein
VAVQLGQARSSASLTSSRLRSSGRRPQPVPAEHGGLLVVPVEDFARRWEVITP